MKCLTINTDASFYEGAGGYAFYIVCDLFKIQKAGMFKSRMKSPHQCEGASIANALAIISNQKELPSIRLIVINTDCKHAIRDIEKGIRQEPFITINKMINTLKERTGATFSFRYVKAHNGTPDARSWVNDWCDKESKKYRRMHFDILKKQSRKK